MEKQNYNMYIIISELISLLDLILKICLFKSSNVIKKSSAVVFSEKMKHKMSNVLVIDTYQ